MSNPEDVQAIQRLMEAESLRTGRRVPRDPLPSVAAWEAQKDAEAMARYGLAIGVAAIVGAFLIGYRRGRRRSART